MCAAVLGGKYDGVRTTLNGRCREEGAGVSNGPDTASRPGFGGESMWSRESVTLCTFSRAITLCDPSLFQSDNTSFFLMYLCDD